jgi:hypothetical protein
VSGHPCPERLLLPEALSGQLEPAEEKRVMAHLETCPACQDAAADIEIALVSLALLRVSREEEAGGELPAPVQAATATLTLTPEEPEVPERPEGSTGPTGPVEAADLDQARRARRPHRLRNQLAAVAAGIVLLAGGAVVGRQLLPPRDAVGYGPAIALAPPAGAPDRAARGSVAVALEGAALAVRLNATALPTAPWYECVWISGGQTRSAGSFRATNGKVHVELRVAPPKGDTKWDLQVIAHQGTTSTVVLEGANFTT